MGGSLLAATFADGDVMDDLVPLIRRDWVERFYFELPEPMGPMPIVKGSKRSMIPHRITFVYERTEGYPPTALLGDPVWRFCGISILGTEGEGRRFVTISELAEESRRLGELVANHCRRFMEERHGSEAPQGAIAAEQGS
jgi:hypothetical protein